MKKIRSMNYSANHPSQDLFESDLDEAIAQSRKEIAAGDYVVETVAEHMARLEAMLKDEA
jgi:hypothetical protein